MTISSRCIPQFPVLGLITRLPRRTFNKKKGVHNVLNYVRVDGNYLHYYWSSQHHGPALPPPCTDVIDADLYYHTVKCHGIEQITKWRRDHELRRYLWTGLARMKSTYELATIHWKVTTDVHHAQILVLQSCFVQFTLISPSTTKPART